jgi:hypothetical protein
MSIPLETLPYTPDDSGKDDARSENPPIPVVCRMLRTKTGFGNYDAGPDQVPWQFGESTTAVFWCLCTMSMAGPDDGLVHPQNCQSGRSCFHAPE